MPNFRNISIVAAALLAATMPSSIHARGRRGLKSPKKGNPGKTSKGKGGTLAPTEECVKIPDLTFKDMVPRFVGYDPAELDPAYPGSFFPSNGYTKCGGTKDLDENGWGECTYKHFLVINLCDDNFRFENLCEADLLKVYQVYAPFGPFDGVIEVLGSCPPPIAQLL